MDPGETPVESAVRELREEAGILPGEVIKFEVQKVPGKTHHIFYTLSHSGDITLPDGECDDFCWVTRDEARLFPLIPQLQNNMHRIFDLVETTGGLDAF